MKSAPRKKPEIIYRDGKPAAVLLDIEEYRELLERLEDIEDLKLLNEVREGKPEYRDLDDFLKEQDSGSQDSD